MQATTTVNSIHAHLASEKKGSTSSVRALHNTLLTELPGAAFAFLTLVWVVSSLVRL
ncbi:MAG TPA: hypothetical protein VKV03_04150 [Candidatus Binataceae bacterium]|nr:hypothetical protein [Candidatus Binataceae bacterium]